jgi:hypothetical protein
MLLFTPAMKRPKLKNAWSYTSAPVTACYAVDRHRLEFVFYRLDAIRARSTRRIRGVFSSPPGCVRSVTDF